MNILIPIAVVGIGLLLAPKKKPRPSLNPDGFFADNVYSIQGNEDPNVVMPYPAVMVATDSLNAEQCADVIGPFAEEYPQLFFFFIAAENLEVALAAVGGTQTFFDMVAVTVILQPTTVPDFTALHPGTTAGLEVGLVDALAFFNTPRSVSGLSMGTREGRSMRRGRSISASTAAVPPTLRQLVSTSLRR